MPGSDQRADRCHDAGVGAFNASAVKRKTSDSEWAGAARAFLLWNKAGRVVGGLATRCRVESGSTLRHGAGSEPSAMEQGASRHEPAIYSNSRCSR
ncbi:glycoside hydrolase family protein [Cupriavidus necator]|uniref:glycoside hydrolase family protein n=1 Tax=Cupriavidus necator TaxID=106590 RepID=UPI003C6C0902